MPIKEIIKRTYPEAKPVPERPSETVKEAPFQKTAELERAESRGEGGKVIRPSSRPVRPPSPPYAKDPAFVRVEAILEDNLEAIYGELPAELKAKFKAKGEETAHAIIAMMERAKVKARKVLKLIADWLKMIPGINKFFVEQEAAIKTQKIMQLASDRERKR